LGEGGGCASRSLDLSLTSLAFAPTTSDSAPPPSPLPGPRRSPRPLTSTPATSSPKASTIHRPSSAPATKRLGDLQLSASAMACSTGLLAGRRPTGASAEKAARAEASATSGLEIVLGWKLSLAGSERSCSAGAAAAAAVSSAPVGLLVGGRSGAPIHASAVLPKCLSEKEDMTPERLGQGMAPERYTAHH
jgi:hypothetical protein